MKKLLMFLFLMSGFLRGMDTGDGALSSAIYDGDARRVLALIARGIVPNNYHLRSSNVRLQSGIDVEYDEYTHGGYDFPHQEHGIPMLQDRIINIILCYPKEILINKVEDLIGRSFGNSGVCQIRDFDARYIRLLLSEQSSGINR